MKKISAAIIDTYTDKKFASIAIKMVKKISVVEDIHVFSDTPFDNVSGINFIKQNTIDKSNDDSKQDDWLIIKYHLNNVREYLMSKIY